MSFQLTHTNPSALSWGMPIPALHRQNIFPPLSLVITLLASEHPGNCWNQLEEFLWEAGVYSSEHILLTDPTVLALVGNIGAWQATVLRNCAKHVILAILGLQGTYQEDENINDDPTSAAPTYKWPLDLGESVVYGLYKKQRISNSDIPTPPSENDLGEYLVDNQNPNFEFDNRAAEMEDEEGKGSDSDEEEDKLYSEDAEGEEADEELWTGGSLIFMIISLFMTIFTSIGFNKPSLPIT